MGRILLMATKQQLDEYFVTAVAKTISHVREFQGRFWYKNLEHPALFGEFVTALRREMKAISNVLPQLSPFCASICCKEAWLTVGQPKYDYTYRRRGNHTTSWTFSTLVSDGEWYMDYDRASQLCQQANLKAKYQTPEQESSVEVTIQLSRLEQQLKEMNATVGVAASLNGEADKVCIKLCEIAESLV